MKTGPGSVAGSLILSMALALGLVATAPVVAPPAQAVVAIHISGTVTGSGPAPLEGIAVRAINDGGLYGTVSTAADGTWSLAVPAGSYKLTLTDPGGTYAFGYYSSSAVGHYTTDPSLATMVDATSADVGGIDVYMPLVLATVPDAPTAVTASAGAASAVVTWTAPASDGGAMITGYMVTSAPGGKTCTWTTGPLTCTVTGLTIGQAYTFTVTATNACGTGPASDPSNSVTPAAVPGAPTIGTATRGDTRRP